MCACIVNHFRNFMLITHEMVHTIDEMKSYKMLKKSLKINNYWYINKNVFGIITINAECRQSLIISISVVNFHWIGRYIV
jgi:hypothetical protein